MDTYKLKIDKFKNIRIENFPTEFDFGIVSKEENVQVLIYYIDKLEDLDNFVSLCNSLSLSPENRTILVYKKGRKDGVNRDSLFKPFFDEKKYQGFKLRAPMLCSLSKDYSACVMSKET